MFRIWIIIRCFLKVIVVAPFFGLWFTVDTIMGFIKNDWRIFKSNGNTIQE